MRGHNVVTSGLLLTGVFALGAGPASGREVSPGGHIHTGAVEPALEGKLISPVEAGQFGSSVGVSGDTVIAGARVDSTAGLEAGAAYVFVRSAGDWMPQARLVAPDAYPYDSFGYSAAVDADTAVIGARYDNLAGDRNVGSAYVFVRTESVWTSQAKLRASDGAVNDEFGTSVALDGDTAVVGTDDTLTGTDPGSAYVFVRSGRSWSQQAKLVASDGAVLDEFGVSVAVSGDTAVVGARGDDAAVGNDAGSAYVFVRSGSSWYQQAKLVASDQAVAAEFGYAVAISGDTILVGAHLQDSNAGAAYVFVRSGSEFTEQAELTAPDAAGGEQFGWSVGLDGETAVVGAPHDRTTDGTEVGSAHVFIRSGTTWSWQARLSAPDAAMGDSFGWSVALNGRRVVVGAPYDDTQVSADAGSAYVFVPD